MSLADTLKNHIVIVVSGTAVAGFGAGWGAYKSTVDAQGQELILKTKRDDLEQRAGLLDSCRKDLAQANTNSSSRCPSQSAEVSKQRPRFSDGQWRYFAVPNAGGTEVARRLTEIGPPQDSVVVAYDGHPNNNTFHVWYRGQGTSTRYTYTWGKPSDLSDPPRMNYFLSEPGVIPAGIGGEGAASTPIPLYFVASQ